MFYDRMILINTHSPLPYVLNTMLAKREHRVCVMAATVPARRDGQPNDKAPAHEVIEGAGIAANVSSI
jgi:hypothetical protein